MRPVADVAEQLTGSRPSKATQWRWLRQGVRGIRLQAQLCGRRWLTTEEDFLRFMEGQTRKELGTSTAVADDRLAAAGLL